MTAKPTLKFTIDLTQELSPSELKSFVKMARKEKAKSCKEHFCNVFLRKPEISSKQPA